MLTNKLLSVIMFSLFLLFINMASSCADEPVYLNSSQLRLVDTLVKHQIVPLQREIDSLCNLRFDEEVERAKDSIINVRMEEINKKMRQ